VGLTAIPTITTPHTIEAESDVDLPLALGWDVVEPLTAHVLESICLIPEELAEELTEEGLKL